MREAYVKFRLKNNFEKPGVILRVASINFLVSKCKMKDMSLKSANVSGQIFANFNTFICKISLCNWFCRLVGIVLILLLEDLESHVF